MQKHIFGKKLKRDVNERRALFKGLASSLVVEERIQTTEAKAKAVRSGVEKLVTKAKKTTDTRHAYALLQPYLTSQAVKKILTDVAPRFQNRNGGYTRIIRIGNRFSDNAPMVVMEWVEKAVKADAPVSENKQKKTSRKADQAVAKALYGGEEIKTKNEKVKSKKVETKSKNTARKTAAKKEKK